MDRRSFLRNAGLGSAALMASCRSMAEPFTSTRPNIVLIMTDDQGFECVRANGGTSYQTPNLDKLAREGVRFTDCHAQPLCTPSRVKIMTGKYNFRNYEEFGYLNPEETTFGNVLRDNGYATSIVGKWQLGRDMDYIAQAGFDDYFLYHWKGGAPTRYWNEIFMRNGETLEAGQKDWGPDLVRDHALTFMEAHKDEPFFLYYPMHLPHSRWYATPDSGVEEPWHNKGKKFFADHVAYIDKIVGQIDKKLKELGIRENTLLIFTSDNGTSRHITSMLAGEEVPGRKGTHEETATHVPLIVNYPKMQKGGQVVDDLIGFTDFFPTLLDAAGIQKPENLHLDGRSFLPQIKGEEGNPREWLFFSYPGKGWQPAGTWVRGKRFTLNVNGELYDRRKDPLQKNAIRPGEASPAAKKARKDLSKVFERMEKEWKRTRDGKIWGK